MRKSAIVPLSLILLAASGPGAQAAAKPSTAKAERAVERLVDFKYSGMLDGRNVIATCQRDGSRRWECIYGALKNGDDGFEDGRNDGDTSEIFEYKGTASVTLRKGSRTYRARASRPESTRY